MNKAGTYICAVQGFMGSLWNDSIISGLSRQKGDQVSLKEHLDMVDSDVCHNRSLALPLLHKFLYLEKNLFLISEKTQPGRGTQSSVCGRKLQTGILLGH